MMMPKLKTTVALVLPVLGVGLFWAVNGRAQSATRGAVAGAAAVRNEPQKRIAAPDVWVTFTAELRQETPDAAPVVGRFYRASNGSSRTESGPESEPARVVDIKNIARGLYFTKARTPEGGEYWVEQPLVLPAEGWKPMQMAERADRLILKELFDGRQVVQVVAGPGSVHFLAPSLNYYPVVKSRPLTGERTSAHVVSTAEPAAELFEPPAGATIRRSEKPGGIVFETNPAPKP